MAVYPLADAIGLVYFVAIHPTLTHPPIFAEPLQIYCHHCQEEFTATTIDVEMYCEAPIKEFLSRRFCISIGGERSVSVLN
jgi:hypothetical protein